MNRSARLGVAVLLLISPVVAATVVVRETLDQMASRTPVIVRGIAGPSQAHWTEDRRRIDTDTEVRVMHVLKGPANAVLLVRQPGGAVGGVALRVSGTAIFHPGEEVIVFLEPAPGEQAVYLLRGMAAGKVQLVPTGSGERRAVRRLAGLEFYEPGASPGPRTARPGDEELGPAEELIQRLSRAIAAGQPK